MRRASLVFSAVGFSYLFMIVRDLLLANHFGNSPELNAFLVTMIVPGFLLNVFTGAMSNSLVPKIVEIQRSRGPKVFAEYLMNLIFATALSLGALTVILLLSAPLWHEPLIASMSEENRIFARGMVGPAMMVFFLQMSPVFFRVLFAACGHLRAATMAPMINSVVLAAALTFASPSNVPSYLQQLGMAYAIELVFLIVNGVLIFRLPLFFRPSLSGFRELLDRHFLFPASSSVFTAFSLMFDQGLAAQLDPGGVVALGYGQKITSSMIGVLAGGLSLLVFPELAKLGAQMQWGALRARVRRLAWGAFGSSLVVTLALAALSIPCIRLLFERGAFTSADTDLVGKINALCLLQIPFYLATQIGLKGLYSMKKGFDITKIAFINIFLNIGADLLFVQFFGVAGIALATSCVSVFSTIAVFYFVSRASEHENTNVDQPPVRQSRPA